MHCFIFTVYRITGKKILQVAGFCILMMLSYRNASAQACTGYVLYREDFGGNASSPVVGGRLPAGVTSYTYTANTPVEDGFYGIRKRVTGHQGSWFRATDHTGNGYMMLVNASYTPGLFYETKVTDLCQGSSFYFSAWVANLMMAGAGGPLDPNLKFVIRKASDSTVIDSLETGTLPRYSRFTWEQYGINFSLPAGESSVILQVFNNQTGGNGNDLVLDDITFSLCGPAIRVTQAGLYQNTHDVCTGDKISFGATIAPGFYKDPEYQWQFSRDTLDWQDIPGAATPGYEIGAAGPADSGWYRIRIAEKGNINTLHCHIASPPLPLNVWSPQPFTITSNSPVCEGAPLRLSAPPALIFQWQGPGGFTSDRPSLEFGEATAAQQGNYRLTRTTKGGCTSHAQTMVTVQPQDLAVALGDDSVLCEGEVIRLDATNAGAAYQWNTGSRDAVLQVDTGGFYRVVVSKGACEKSDSISIREILKPVADLGNDTTICIGEPYTLDASFKAAKRYLWQDGSTMPDYPVSRTGTYAVTVSNACGSATDAVHIKMEACADHLVFPTAFSPNGDGQNDFFRPRVFIRVTGYEMKIFDRWGRLVFRSADPDAGWDGRHTGVSLPAGAYVWMARYTRERDHKPLAQHGAVTLIR